MVERIIGCHLHVRQNSKRATNLHQMDFSWATIVVVRTSPISHVALELKNNVGVLHRSKTHGRTNNDNHGQRDVKQDGIE